MLSPFQAILDYELSRGIPPGWVNFCISRTAPDGFWHRLETGSIPMDADFFAGFNRDLHDMSRWEEFYRKQQAQDPQLPKETPPLPEIDGERLFYDMMSSSASPDPWMLPALRNLKASGKFVIAALSNTVIFPETHELSKKHGPSSPIRDLFDIFISSAHVGIRKPDPRMYQLALILVNQFMKDNADSDRGKALGWKSGVRPEEILFLDDIGENLKAAKAQGFRTIKVPLGSAYEAVDELEKITGLSLAGDHPRIPIKPRLDAAKAKM